VTDAQTFRKDMGKAIRAARKARGFGASAFVERLGEFGLSTSDSALNRIEVGERGVEVHELLVIAAALDVSPDVLALPEDPDKPDPDRLVALTSVLVEPVETLRAWWSGRRLLHGAHRRGKRPTWPFPEDLSLHRVRERDEQWRSRRPIVERRAYAQDGVEQLVQAANHLVAVAGRRPKPSAPDRVAMVKAAIDAWQASQQVLRANRPDHPLVATASLELKAIIAAAAAQNEEGRS
jgi:transcriptional regulator with XRE-family HTH domain